LSGVDWAISPGYRGGAAPRWQSLASESTAETGVM
jgi:hypothetical protein